MSSMTAEKLAQRVFELGLLTNQELNSIWSELGTRNVSVEEFISVALRRELLTNFQIDRVLKGERTGYFYGKYKVFYLIGTGSFARVYRAVHTETGRVVAVKVLRKRYREDPVEFEQFLREGRVGAALKHPNIVPIYEINGDPREPYMVMEFVEGQTWREMLRIRKKLDPLTSLKILADVLAGLQYAAEQGITHRDLKLSNVLVSSTGRAKLVDFGLAAAQTDDNKIADCPNARAIDYAALERGTGVRKDDTRSDLYFAGCLLYHALCGRPPLYETKDRIQRLNITRFREIPPLGQLEPNLPNYVVAIVNKAMELDPSKRYQTPLEMLRDVQQAIKRLERGETNAPGASGDGEPSAGSAHVDTAVENEEPTPQVLEGDWRTLLVVESSHAMQNLLRDRLKKRGYRVLIMSDAERARERFQDGEYVADCIVFSTTEMEEQAVEAFNRFGEDERTKDIPAILILHQANPRWQQAARTNNHRLILSTPKLGELLSALRRLLRQTSSAPS